METDVIVVGAGPVGTTLALLLAQAGVTVLLADHAADIYPLPRAAHIDHEIVRVFQALGAAEAVTAASRVTANYDFLTAGGELLMRFGGADRLGPGGWPAANMIHQPSVEAALRARFAAAPSLTARTEWTLIDYVAAPQGVRARFDTPEGEKTVGGRYLVGCDGARSTVRGVEGIDLEDLDFDEPWLVIDTLVLDPSRLPTANLQICDPNRPTTCVLMGSGRHRWEFMLKPGETPEAALDDDFIAACLAPWNVEGAVTLERKAVYRFHALIARQWRRGRVFLAGDAAHQTPPFAGQGLCAGVRDAANLAWKLAAVLRGDAGDALLDSYQTERTPHVRAAIDLALMMGRTVCITDPAAAAARDSALLAQRAGQASESGPPPADGGLGPGCWLEGWPGAGEYFPQPRAGDGAAITRLDDSAGPGAWLVTRKSEAGAPGLAALAIDDPVFAPFAPDVSRWLDRHGAEAVLVRPDRYVFAAGSPGALREAWATALTGRS